MTEERLPAPDGWEEREEVSKILEKYRGRDPTIFEHESGEAAVQVVPAEPNEAHGDVHDWRVDVVEFDESHPTHVEPIEEFEERPDALERAREVMRELEARGVEGSAEELAAAVS